MILLFFWCILPPNLFKAFFLSTPPSSIFGVSIYLFLYISISLHTIRMSHRTRNRIEFLLSLSLSISLAFQNTFENSTEPHFRAPFSKKGKQNLDRGAIQHNSWLSTKLVPPSLLRCKPAPCTPETPKHPQHMHTHVQPRSTAWVLVSRRFCNTLFGILIRSTVTNPRHKLVYTKQVDNIYLYIYLSYISMLWLCFMFLYFYWTHSTLCIYVIRERHI